MSLSILTASPLPAATRGVFYSEAFTATGGSGVYFWYVTEGLFPPGLSLNAITGANTGTPTGSGNYFFTVTVFDSLGEGASKSFSLLVNASTSALLGVPFNQNNLRHFHYNKPVSEWEKVTVKHTYQDGGASFNANNTTAPQYFEWEFTGLTPTERAVFDAHHDAARGELFDFPYTDKDGTFYESGTRYLKYESSHDANESWANRVKVTLVRYP